MAGRCSGSGSDSRPAADTVRPTQGRLRCRPIRGAEGKVIGADYNVVFWHLEFSKFERFHDRHYC